MIKIWNLTMLKIMGLQIILGRIIFILIFFILVLPILFLLEPFKKFRFVLVSCLRFGSMALQLEYYLRREQVTFKDPSVFRIFISGKPVNRELLEMYKKYLRIFEIPWLFRLFFIYGGGGPFLSHFRFFEHYWHKDGHQLFRKTKPCLSFSSTQEAEGQKWLRERGIGEKDWYICINVRDSRFLNTLYSNHFTYGSLIKNDWSYYDYRNGNINDLKLGIQYILDQGGFVIRMGYLVENIFQFEHPKVIDYATYYRTEFLDIYLPSKCHFYLGTPGGSGEFFMIYNKPRAIVNAIPCGWVPWGKDDVFIPKLVKKERTGEFISLGRIIRENLSKIASPDTLDESDHLNKLGMIYENNSPQEILSLTKERLDKLNGTFQEKKAYQALLNKYYQNYSEGHYYANLNTPIGQEFLLEHKDVLV